MMHNCQRNLIDRASITPASRRWVIGALCGGTGMVLLGHPIGHVAAQGTPTRATPSVATTPVPLEEAVDDLVPRAVWEYFFQLTQIPRPSHHEEQVSAFLADFGRDLGLDTEVDEVGNVFIRKPASPGMEDRPGVILQAHMDMVPVKSSDSTHNFETDPIAAFAEDGWVRADGTTLGADDGMGIALIMALLQDETLVHGSLEALFTVDEEGDFTGANAVQPGDLHGAMLINVDSEEEGAFTIGSAGGIYVDATTSYQQAPTPTGLAGIRLAVTGLQGGHSGEDINRGRGNAIKMLVRLLATMQESFTVRLSSLTGGGLYNAIPQEAAAVVAVPEAQAPPLIEFAREFAATVRQELAATEPELAIAATTVASPNTVMTPDAQRWIVAALYAAPNGVMRMSDSVPGLVETSTNLGSVTATNGQFAAGFFVRSAVNSEQDDVQQMIESVFDLAGIETNAHDAYSGWTPDPDSPLLNLMQTVYRDLWGHEAEILAVHAGLETSVFGAKSPGLDMISVGPTMQNVHSPSEQLEIDSVGKVYDLLVATLERIPARDNGSG